MRRKKDGADEDWKAAAQKETHGLGVLGGGCGLWVPGLEGSRVRGGRRGGALRLGKVQSRAGGPGLGWEMKGSGGWSWRRRCGGGVGGCRERESRWARVGRDRDGFPPAPNRLGCLVRLSDGAAECLSESPQRGWACTKDPVLGCRLRVMACAYQCLCSC